MLAGPGDRATRDDPGHERAVPWPLRPVVRQRPRLTCRPPSTSRPDARVNAGVSLTPVSTDGTDT